MLKQFLSHCSAQGVALARQRTVMAGSSYCARGFATTDAVKSGHATPHNFNLNDLPLPEGSHEEEMKKKIQKENKVLGVGIVMFALTVAFTLVQGTFSVRKFPDLGKNTEAGLEFLKYPYEPERCEDCGRGAYNDAEFAAK